MLNNNQRTVYFYLVNEPIFHSMLYSADYPTFRELLLKSVPDYFYRLTGVKIHSDYDDRLFDPLRGKMITWFNRFNDFDYDLSIIELILKDCNIDNFTGHDMIALFNFIQARYHGRSICLDIL